ncbi:(3R)-3-hydroxyacyl-CoA dehydrogenase isoform X1 [Dermacentor silvarum]|uniref:(3R)-3-hydroxyacyl-CoA dehydrogenase isoform X1 n=2 Tax=Dermacentor silvarum TaxID=543639 RepID=UPI00189A86B1|nr:(3R)-3-hydroxyacyl-CoA dehydrogenase isoform X1 [Dermacentor silvarum]
MFYRFADLASTSPSSRVSMSLYPRLALVTGGAGGIGKATCHALAAQGASVIVADLKLDAAKLVASELPGAGTHRGVLLDVSDTNSVDRLFADIKDTESLPVSIVVNCAGIAKSSPLVDTTDENFVRTLQVNLKGTFLVTRAAARAMIATGVTEGVIVNIASIVGRIGCSGMAAYSASKGGVVALTKTVAQEMAPHGIRCNVVLPSLTKTPMADSLPEKTQKTCIALTPLQRAAEPEEVAEAILFLCSPNSSFVTGVTLEVTGGLIM